MERYRLSCCSALAAVSLQPQLLGDQRPTGFPTKDRCAYQRMCLYDPAPMFVNCRRSAHVSHFVLCTPLKPTQAPGMQSTLEYWKMLWRMWLPELLGCAPGYIHSEETRDASCHGAAPFKTRVLKYKVVLKRPQPCHVHG